MATVKQAASLEPRQEKFCQLYVSKEFFGNGVETYLEVYDIDRTKPKWYKTACASASRLLSNAKVYNRINQLLNEAGFNDNHADKQLLFLMTQHVDFSSKLGALREYNKLKKRIDGRMPGSDANNPLYILDMAKQGTKE